MRKRCFFCRLLAACAALCLCLTPLTTCAEQPPADARQPGVTYTDLMSDMNRQIAATLVQDMPHASCWSAAQEHVLVYGESGKETEAAAPVLAKLDLAAENYALLALTLPDIPEDLAATREAWAQKEQALYAAADAAPQPPSAADDAGSALPREYTIPTHAVVDILAQNEAQQIFLLLDDSLQRVTTDAAGCSVPLIVERAVTLCEVAADGAVQPRVRLQLPEEYAALETIGKACFWGADQTLWVTATDLLQNRTHLLRFSLADGTLLTTLSLPQETPLRAGCFWPLSDDSVAVLVTGEAERSDANTLSILWRKIFPATRRSGPRPFLCPSCPKPRRCFLPCRSCRPIPTQDLHSRPVAASTVGTGQPTRSPSGCPGWHFRSTPSI